jgi:hypothetical protein
LETRQGSIHEPLALVRDKRGIIAIFAVPVKEKTAGAPATPWKTSPWTAILRSCSRRLRAIAPSFSRGCAVPFEQAAPDVDEAALPGESCAATAERLAVSQGAGPGRRFPAR